MSSSSTAPELPVPLVEAVREQRAVLFLGAGASKGAIHQHGHDVPTGDALRDKLSDRFLGGDLKSRPLIQVAELSINETDLPTVQSFIREVFLEFQPAAQHLLIPTFRWHAIVTTNYDLLVERAYQKVAGPLQELVPFVKNGEKVETELKKAVNGVQYLKLHGCINHHLDPDIPLILATEHYAKYEKHRTRLFERLRDWGSELPIIFCGYSIADPHIQKILFDLFDLGITRPAFFVVEPRFTSIEERYWTRHRLFPIKATFQEFMQALDSGLPTVQRVIPRGMGGGAASIRSHYRVANAVESGQLSAFLRDDVDHIRKGMPIAAQDPKAFYHGYDTGWGAIEADLDVRRRLLDTVLIDAVLADEAERSGPVDMFVLKGPAGNGKTVALKRIAWEAAHEYDKLVLYLRPDGAIRVDALREIFTLSGKRTYLFVDRAAVRHEEIRHVIEECQNQNVPITIVCAERDNEWNVRCEDLDEFVSKDYPIRFFSEKEVHQLLGKLEAQGALGRLEPLTYPERVDAFLNRAARQILVALHEATLGRPFVEIVIDEYKRVVPTEAQSLYLDVCTLNRVGVGVRAGLIARVSGVRFEEFKERFFRPLEHVVRAYHDPYLADYVYVARHQHVAELVFDNLLDDPEARYSQLVRIVRGMNIDYSTDLQAFRQLVRGRVVVETFRSQELGRKFYEVLASIVGADAYLYQQIAQFEMHHEGGDLVRAEEALKRAVELAPHDRSIRHSFANLARRQALAATNPVLRDAFRRKARERLDGLVGAGSRQPHGYYTAAQLALDELKELLSRGEDALKDVPTERTALDLINRIENYISSGLQRFPENTHLLGLEAEFRDAIQQYSQAEDALRRAFAANPRQEWIATRLARRLVDQTRIAEGKDVLKRCLTENPGSKAAHLALAKLYLEHGSEDEKKRVLDHLGRSFSEGDPNLDAQFWYARELYLQNQLDEALTRFRKLSHTPMAPELRNRIRGVVRDASGGVARFEAEVVKKEETYMFLRSGQVRTAVFCHVSVVPDDDWSRISVGSAVAITLGFTMRGPIAAQVNLL